ncbi:MAG: preprotein translocase subunit SecA [Rickettsiales bacterium]|nr:preprotein translocase subunit SecA [Rickettsiales bacterium]
MGNIAKSLFGSSNDRFVKPLQKDVLRINALEEETAKLSDEELRGRSLWFRERLSGKETLDDILHEAFATVREASKRALGMRPFDVQLVGAMVLHKGMISEMKTGEGKTLVATLAVYLNAVEGKGVHVVTVNDYLAERDAAWMGALYEFLGLSVGCILNNLDDAERQAAYACDITYGTNNEFGFDYLRDNMKFSREEMVQRPFNFAVIDEVDSILIDEARTPLIISGPTEDNSDLYTQIDKLLPEIKEEHFEKDEKSRSVSLTEEGVEFMEELLIRGGLMEQGEGLYDINNVSLVHHVNQALKAHTLFTKEVDYIVQDNKVVIIDEFTGRMMEGRRYSEGLHQALEAKEDAQIQNENQTLASITFQNYFRMYPKLSGMTGTAMTEASEFGDIYGLEVIAIPTNVPVARDDSDDEIYRTAVERYEAVIEQIKDCHDRGQPVLVGTVSIEKSEYLANLLKKAKVPHHVLNAKHHESEAQIVAQAGRPGGVTIATNMAGRGTDIMLGGNPEFEDEKGKKLSSSAYAANKQKVLEAGGLYVIGTERHESRRIDNQLRGRSGRQGDPGGSKFYLSLEDDLMRIFGSERIDGVLKKLGLQEGEAITHPWMNKAIEKAQGKVEARNYDMRKNLLKFDDVMNDQRKVIFGQRIEMMEEEDLSDVTEEMREDVTSETVEGYIPPKSYPEQWEPESLEKEVYRLFGLHLPVTEWAAEEGIGTEEISERVMQAVAALMQDKEKRFTEPMMRMVEKHVLLQTLDELWKDHLLQLDQLRQGIGLRGYGQKDPLNEYKREAFALFSDLLTRLRELTTNRLAHIEVQTQAPEELEPLQQTQEMHENRGPQAESEGASAQMRVRPEHRDANNPESWGRVGRNELCPCESGKKYKHCHGKLD